MRILVVDAIVDAAQSLASLLRNCGYETDVCYSARDALRLAQQKQHDTVLLDVSMPDMDGYEMARRLRSQSLSVMKIVAVTDRDRDQSEIESPDEDDAAPVFDHYVAKPARMNTLCSIIDCR